jgi:radical SAM superfamily enzyme YgiQ (UPF0313 family)
MDYWKNSVRDSPHCDDGEFVSKSREAQNTIETYPPIRKVDYSDTVGDNTELKDYIDLLKTKFSVNKKLLLVQIPQFDFRYFNSFTAKNRGYYAYPPTGLQYLASSLEEKDLEVKILDLNYELLVRVNADEKFGPDKWLTILDEYLESFPASIIGVSCIFDTGIRPLLDILDHLKNRDDAIVLAGGVVPTYDWEKLLSQNLCHFVCEGESENKINFLLGQLIDDEVETTPTPGIRFRHKGQFNESYGSPDIVDPKGNLINTYQQIPIEKYYKIGSLNPFTRMAGIDRPYAAIILNRGCRAACTFCAVRDFNGKGVRTRNVDETLEEIIYLNRERGIKHFEFLDDDLLRYDDAVFQLLQGIIDNNLDLTWSANNGLICNALSHDILKLFEKTNCTGFRIGIETGNAEMLKAVQKPATLPSLRRASGLLRDYPKLFIGGNIIIGFNDEKFHQILDSFWFSIEMDVDWTAYTICQVIRGATAFENFTEYFSDRITSHGETIANFIPSRDSSKGEIETSSDIFSGIDIFDLPLNSEPNKDQVREIWFTFNIIGNFINNKNLKIGGQPKKFINWVSMAQVSYPQNPYMCLFLALAYRLTGSETDCNDQYDRLLANLKGSKYWANRLDQFELSIFAEDFPKTSDEVLDRLDSLRASIFDKVKITVPDNVAEYL